MLPWNYYSLQNVRKRQIDTLKIFNDLVTEINDNSEYRVDFTVGTKNMSLVVVLSPEFPKEKPAIFVNPPVPHPWVADNTNQVVSAPGLLNFSMHSDLGRVVHAIIREFQRRLSDEIDEVNNSNDVSPTSNFVVQSTMFPELNDMSIEELSDILENTDLQDKMIENNPQLVEIDLETEELMASIEEIAQGNIVKQQMMDELKTDVIERISSIVQMKMSYEELYKKHQKLCQMYDPHRIRDCLKEAAAKADEDAEVIAEQFLLGNMPVEMFVTKFAEKKSIGASKESKGRKTGASTIPTG